MSLYNYVDTPNSNLICCICRTPFTDPTTVRTCAHTFCKDCILRAIEHSPHCPVDRSPLTPSNLTPANPIVRSLVDELMVECVHRVKGCMYTCERQFLSSHLRDSCAYREVPCPQGKCGESILYKDVSTHTHDGDGTSSTVVKDNADFTADDDRTTVTHTRSEYADQEGNDTTSSSLPTCLPPAARSTNTGTCDPIHSHSTDPRISTLTEQNILLRQRVDGLEGLVQDMQREMEAMKRALGPWYRAGEGPRAGERISRYHSLSEIPPGMQPSSASPSSSSAGGDTTVRPENSSAPEVPCPYPYSYRPPYSLPAYLPSDSLAPYFPEETEETDTFHPVRRSPTHAHARGTSGMINSHDGHTQGLFSPLHQNIHMPTVAPLNLSGTLEGTLHGLRESVVGLAASVDSMGRRQEIALTNETMRIGEEVGGLRAGVHGLRMQVHAIMMDRNAQITGRDGVGDGSAGQWTQLPMPPTRVHNPQPPSITKL